MATEVPPVHNPDSRIQSFIGMGTRTAGFKNPPAEEPPMNNLLLNLYVRFQILIDREDGQDMVEYALAVALIALAAVASTKSLATGINAAFSNISSKLSSAIS
jgi:pilus assembly protein Flp/PilA